MLCEKEEDAVLLLSPNPHSQHTHTLQRPFPRTLRKRALNPPREWHTGVATLPPWCNEPCSSNIGPAGDGMPPSSFFSFFHPHHHRRRVEADLLPSLLLAILAKRRRVKEKCHQLGEKKSLRNGCPRSSAAAERGRLPEIGNKPSTIEE